MILADLHLGYEAVLESEGFAMPRLQTREMFVRFERAAELYSPKRVLIVGDLKHNFDRNLRAEWDEVVGFVELARSKAELLVLKGNHDNYLANILSRHGIPLEKECSLGGISVQHGHETTAAKGEGMVFGHEHPSLRLREKTGASVKVPCFLYEAGSNRLVLPAFSTMAIGSDVIGTPDSERMIPLLAETGIGGYEALGFSAGQILNYRTVGKLREIGSL